MMEGPGVQINLTGMLPLTMSTYLCMNHGDLSRFFQFEIILNVLTIDIGMSFEYLYYGSMAVIISFLILSVQGSTLDFRI